MENNELMQVEFNSLSGIAVKLDAQTVRNTLTRGNGKVSDQEVAMFLRTCQAKRLDPLENGEVYLIKYDDRTPANLVVGYFAYIRRADHFPDYRGFKAGVCVAFKSGKDGYRTDKDGIPLVERREGAAVYDMLGEVLIGGWCRVYRERNNGSVEETFMEVSLKEYSTGKSNWGAKPATMIRKVAISQAFRAAFPNEYEGLYTVDEMAASGAIPANYRVVEETGELVETDPPVEEDPVISQEQRQMLFRVAKTHFGEQANDILKSIIEENGCKSTTGMLLSVYGKVMDRLMEIAGERKSQDEEEPANEDTGTAGE